MPTRLYQLFSTFHWSACIKQRKWHVMYLWVRGFHFSSFIPCFYYIDFNQLRQWGNCCLSFYSNVSVAVCECVFVCVCLFVYLCALDQVSSTYKTDRHHITEIWLKLNTITQTLYICVLLIIVCQSLFVNIGYSNQELLPLQLFQWHQVLLVRFTHPSLISM